MGAGTYALVKTVISGETITAADRNSEHQNHINNHDFAGLDDYSSNATQMQATTDPYPSAVESLATDGKGELERIRYLIKQITGQAQWYVDPTQFLAGNGTVLLPIYSFAGDPNSGLYWVSANDIAISLDGVMRVDFTTSGIYNQAGTALVPSYSFQGDVNTGLYWISADKIGIATGGVLQLSIDSTGYALFAGVISVGYGTAAAPAIGFAGDTSTGFYRLALNQIGIATAGVQRFSISDVGNFDPVGAGALSTGTATSYWNDISYKTLTDRGCLGSFDKGVELQDGRIVSDTEALLEIKERKDKQTVYGVPMLDYRTFPKVSYKKADQDGVLFGRNEKDEPISGSDGVEMTSMFSIMIGAIKELTLRVKALEAN